MDLSRFSTEDLMALRSGDLSRVSTEGLQAMKTGAQPADDPGAHLRPAAMRQKLLDNVVGAARHAGGIGATFLTPYDMLVGNTKSVFNPERRAVYDEQAKATGANPESLSFKGAGLLTDVVATAGVPGMLGKAVSAVAPRLGQAIATGGFSTGAAPAAGVIPKAADMAIRSSGGLVAGGAQAGLIDPEFAVPGAAIGAALPPVLKAGAAVGSAAGKGWRAIVKPAEQRAVESLARSLGAKTEAEIDAIAQQLLKPKTLIPGSKPTVAQVLRNPEASGLERVIAAGPGGDALRLRKVDQAAARMAALEGVAPVNPTGLRSAQQDTGALIAKRAIADDTAARARTRQLYQSVPQDEAALYLPDLGAVRDDFFSSGSFANRGPADAAVNTAKNIGTITMKAGKPVTAGQGSMTLAQAVRKAGKLSSVDHSGVRGELMGLRGDLKNLVVSKGGVSPARMAEKMREAGYLPDDDVGTLLNALRDDATGLPQFSNYDDAGLAMQRAREAKLPPTPERIIPQKITLRQFDNLRSDIGEEMRKASRAGDAKLSASLGKMRQAMDDRINDVVAGDGAIDEVLPIDWADLLTKARQSKIDQVKQFRTGPQAAIFKQGATGEPSVQGGEVAAKFWGNRPGLADDVKAFRRLIGDNQETLGQFRSLLTTEGAATAPKESGQLSVKFAQWVDNTLPGLKEAFTTEQVKMLRRIGADIKRAASAETLGIAKGSNTYQNASMALDLGMLDSPFLGALANRIPVVGNFTGPMLSGLRDTARKTQGAALADLLADPTRAGNALLGFNQSTTPNALTQMLGPDAARLMYRGAPYLAVDR